MSFIIKGLCEVLSLIHVKIDSFIYTVMLKRLNFIDMKTSVLVLVILTLSRK